MATRENATVATGTDSNTLWALAAAAANYDVHNGAPLIGVSGDVGDGFIIALTPVPQGFDAIADEGLRFNAFRSWASNALRVGQAAVKASKAPTAELAQAAVSSVLNGTYKPGRDVDNGIIGSEAAREFKARVRENIMAQISAKVADGSLAAMPNETTIVNTVDANAKAFLETPRGKEVMDSMRNAILTRGTYTVSRKGSGRGETVTGLAINM